MFAVAPAVMDSASSAATGATLGTSVKWKLAGSPTSLNNLAPLACCPRFSTRFVSLAEIVDRKVWFWAFFTSSFNIGALTDKDAVAGKGIYTEQYPKVRPEVAPRFHGAPRLNMDPETHDTLCIACNLCALACPEDCIDVIPMDVEVVVAGKPRRKKVLDEFIFDTSRCMFCALCQEACPTYCLELTQDFELATYSRAGFVWNREMLEQGRETVKYES